MSTASLPVVLILLVASALLNQVGAMDNMTDTTTTMSSVIGTIPDTDTTTTASSVTGTIPDTDTTTTMSSPSGATSLSNLNSSTTTTITTTTENGDTDDSCRLTFGIVHVSV